MGNIYKEALASLAENRSCAIETIISGREGSIGKDLVRHITEAPTVCDDRGFRVAEVSVRKEEERTVISEPVLTEERLIVLGGGHIAVPVAAIGAACGLKVTVVDDRPSFANRQRFPDAEEILCDRFEKAIERIKIRPFDYVVIITRGHKNDADCLRAVLSGSVQPAYIGMIGSRRRVKAQMEILKSEGYTAEQLGRVCSPIGLRIGAVTPAEIAVSIMAEVISYRRLPEHAGNERYLSDSDLELSMLSYLAEDPNPKAVVTVIEAKGSTPRGKGAKMAVSPVGTITGSIGGGCSEAAVMRDAVAIIGTGRYRVVDVDLTGDAAEDEGMACGGIMKVLIEDGSPDTLSE